MEIMANKNGQPKQYFLHPITLEAELFARKLEELRSDSLTIDKELSAALNRVVINIEFLRERSTPQLLSSQSDDIIYMTPFDIKGMGKVFQCRRCLNYIENTQQAVAHVLSNHPKPVCQDLPSNSTKKPSTKKKKKRQQIANMEQPKANIPPMNKKAIKMLQSSPLKTTTELIGIADKLKGIPDYKYLENDLKTLLSESFPNKSIQIYRFGSRANGLGGRDSDLDIYVDIGNTFHIFDKVKSPNSINLIEVIASAMQKQKKCWDRIVCIDKARVPIVKVRHIPTLLDCDIGVSNSIGVVNNYLLEYLFAEQPIVRWLSLYLKNFLKIINVQSHFSTFGITLMVIFYFQIKKLIPSIQRLQCDITDTNKILIGPWVCSFTKIKLRDLRIPVVGITNNNLKLYLKEFFTFYSNFNYEQNIICTYKGQVVPLSNINNYMPERYSINAKEMKLPNPFSGSIAIGQAPFNLCNNVLKKVRKRVLDQFIFYSQEAAKLINIDWN